MLSRSAVVKGRRSNAPFLLLLLLIFVFLKLFLTYCGPPQMMTLRLLHCHRWTETMFVCCMLKLCFVHPLFFSQEDAFFRRGNFPTTVHVGPIMSDLNGWKWPSQHGLWFLVRHPKIAFHFYSNGQLWKLTTILQSDSLCHFNTLVNS